MNIKKLMILAGLACLGLNTAFGQARELDNKNYKHAEPPSWFSNNPFLELNEELARARADGKQGLMVVYNTKGCSYCTMFIKNSLNNPAIAATASKHFVAVALEIFDDTQLVGPQGQVTSVKEFAKQEGVMFSPTILFYDNQGKRIFRITGYQPPERFKQSLQYVTGKHYQSQTIAEYIQQVSQGQTTESGRTNLRKDKLFDQAPYHLQRNIIPASKPLLVIFEKAGSQACDVFHDKVLSDGQVRNSLKHYQVVRLDSMDNTSTIVTPGGSRLTPAAWYKQEGFSHTPALMFFNEQGYTAIKTDNQVLQNRMMNSINYVNERGYNKGWSYQRFARTKAIERNLRKQAMAK